MRTDPLVSIITPFLDVGPYLSEAVRSVLAQTFEDWELILVDDGSRDESGAVARAWADQGPGKIRVVAHPGGANRGISASRNLGFRHARGRWIANLDGDDVWRPEALGTLVDVTERHPEVGLVMASTCYWRSWSPGAGPEDDEILAIGADKNVVIEPPRLLQTLYPLGQGNAPSMNTVLVRADVVETVGGWEETFRTTFEDGAFLSKAFLVAKTYVLEDCLDLYRQRPGSATDVDLVQIRGYARHHRRFLEWLEGHLRACGHDHPETWSKLNLRLRPYRRPIAHKALRVYERALASLEQPAGRQP